jgi:type I restriction enzyme M protein
MDNSELNTSDFGILGGFVSEGGDLESRLENLFYTILENLRNDWDLNNSADLLLTLFFYRRLLCIEENELSVQIKIEKEDRQILLDTFSYLTAQNRDFSDFRYAIINISKQNPILENIYVPLLTALQQEENLERLIKIFHGLNELDFSLKAFSTDEFGSFFNKTLNAEVVCFDNQRNYLAGPDLIYRLLAKLSRPTDNEICFDPSAGQGSVLVELNRVKPNLKFFAQEKDPYTWAICRMNLILNGIYNVALKQENCLLSSSEAEMADFAVGHFQFGLRLETRLIKNRPYISIPFEVTHSNETDCNNLYIQQMLYRLKADGRMICLLPVSALFREGEDRKMREYLLRRDWVEAVITLPAAMMYNSSVPMALLIINKQKSSERKDKILFINASALALNSKSKIYSSLSEAHLNSIESVFCNFKYGDEVFLSQHVSVAETEKVLANKSNLNAKQYAAPFIRELERLSEQGNLIQLADIFKNASPALWVDKSDLTLLNLPFVSKEYIAQSFADYQLQPERLRKFSEQSELEGRLIRESVLIVNPDNNKIRLSFFEFKGQALLISRELLAFAVDESLISIEYLALQLHTLLFAQQFNMFKTDHEADTPDETVFAELKIELPSLNVQEKIIRERKLQLLQEEEQKVEKLRQRLNLDKQEAQNKQSRIISSLHHELGNRLPAILNEFKNLRDYIKDKAGSNEKIELNEAIFPSFEEEIEDSGADKLGQVLQRIESMLIQSISAIDAAGNIVNAERERMNLEYIDLIEFLEDFAKLYSADKGFNISIDAVSDEKDRKEALKTLIDRSQMTTALSNLIENAKNHGFKDRKKYRVNFRVVQSEDKKELIIEYKNDGRAFPKEFSFNDYISYGQYAGDSGNTGIGGYLIHQIIENHDGYLVLRDKIEKHDPFKVQFEIVLPCRKI